MSGSSVRGGAAPRAVVLLPHGLAGRVPGAPLEPPLRSIDTDAGILVAGRAAAPERAGAPAARGRRFLEVDTGLFVETPGEGTPPGPPADRPPVEPGRAVLAPAAGTALSVPDPDGWPPLAGRVDWGLRTEEPAPAADEPLGSLRLAPVRPARHRGRDGLLFSPGRNRGLGEWLASLPDPELAALRLAELGGLELLWSPHGLPEGAPRAGRGLVNRATPLEPLLLPRDRVPRPRLGTRAVRALLGAAEGETAVWWDGPEGEEVTVLRRAAFRTLDRRSVLERAW